MRIGRYRITSRGYLVFGILGVVMIALLVFGVSQMFTGGLSGKQLEVGNSQPSGNSTSENTNGASGTKDNGTNVSQNTGQQETNNNQTNALSLNEKNEALGQVSVVVYFKPDNYELDTSYYGSLEKVIETSVRFKEAHILIEGHFNGVPNLKTTPFRTELAQNRAEMVEAYLVSQGISPDRIEIVNRGSSQPVNKDESWQEIEKNRRVEIRFKPLSQ